MFDMSSAFDTIGRGILLQDLSEIIKSDELHLAGFVLKDVKLQVKYNGVTENIFTQDIGSPQGDCASPIWFICHQYKAILAAIIKFKTPRNILLDVKYNHTYVNKDSYKSDIEKDNSYSYKISRQWKFWFSYRTDVADEAGRLI